MFKYINKYKLRIFTTLITLAYLFAYSQNTFFFYPYEIVLGTLISLLVLRFLIGRHFWGLSLALIFSLLGERIYVGISGYDNITSGFLTGDNEGLKFFLFHLPVITFIIFYTLSIMEFERFKAK